MMVIEGVLSGIILIVCAWSTLSDLKRGIIPNRLLLCAGIAGALLNIWYYGVFARDLAAMHLVNVIIASACALLLYALHIWSAGDSKLLMLVALLIPGRVYTGHELIAAPAASMVIYIFSLAYLYLIAESIYLGIKRRDLLVFSVGQINAKQMLWQWLCVSLYLTLFGQLMLLFWPALYMANPSAMIAVNLILVLLIANWDVCFRPAVLAVFAGLLVCAWLLGGGGFSVPDWHSYLIAALVMLSRWMAEKYNYEEIAVEKLRAGMVLSLGTVLLMKPSRVKGLPTDSTEDLRSRLTQAQVDSVRHWSASRLGRPLVVIVRKLPFAVFISIGTLVFIALECIRQGGWRTW